MTQFKPNQPQQHVQLPDKGIRCTEVLSDTLEGYAGIQQANFNLENGKLAIRFDPRVISREQALHLVHISGKEAATRVMQCRSKSPEACAACAGAMGEALVNHYRRISELPAPAIRFLAGAAGGAIEVNLGQSSLLGSEQVSVEYSEQGIPAAAPEQQGGVTRGKAEIILTAVNALFGLAAFAATQLLPQTNLPWILWSLSYLSGGYYGLLDGIANLKHKRLDVNLLMILAALGAAAIGSPAEGAILLFLFSLSNTLQSFAMDRSRKAIEKLLDLRPPTANVRRGSRVINLPVEQLVLGDIVLVRPGERFPIDGDVISGESDVNQAPITGESMPVHKSAGNPVFAGTVNGNGALEFRVTRLAQDTTLARIVQMVEEAQTSKAHTQRMLDNFEQVYALVVLGGAALLVVIPYLALNQPFYETLYRAMTWLVVASPCALVISTPASILSAIANGARNGILFKGGAHLEKTATLKVVAFDKTGTLTQGKPRLVTLLPLNGLSKEAFLSQAAAVEARSEHPLAAAVVTAALERGIKPGAAAAFRAVPGQGVEGQIEVDGQTQVIWAGGRRMFFERGVEVPQDVLSQVKRLESEGQTVMIVFNHSQGIFIGLLGAADILREDAAEMIRQIKQQGIERVVMLTGDNERVAAQIAVQAGVDEVHANLLPQDKVRLLKMLREKYGPVAMVGDGVNDAPALATADVGIAMGGAGADVALETADMVLMSEDLKKLPHALGLAHRARRVVWQNLSFALAVIVLLILSTFGAHLPLPMGVVGHEGSTVLVVLNGLRLLVYKNQ